MIYAIKVLGLKYVKIGVAKDPKKRALELQVGCPLELRLVAYAGWPDHEELLIHDWLERDWLRGEWFVVGDRANRIIELLRDRQRGYEDWKALSKRQRMRRNRAM